MNDIDKTPTQSLLNSLNQYCLDKLNHTDYEKLISVLVSERNDNYILQNITYNDEAAYNQLISKTINKYQKYNDPMYSNALLKLLESQKLTKLQDYFDDDCTPLNGAQIKPVNGQAILYLHKLQNDQFLTLLITEAGTHINYIDTNVLETKILQLRAAITNGKIQNSTGPETNNEALYSDLKKHASSLYKLLLSPFSKELDNLNHLTVVPDSSTGIFPLEALYDAEEKEYVIKKSYSVSYAPNLSRTAKRTNKSGDLLFVSPALPESSEEYNKNNEVGFNEDLRLLKKYYRNPSSELRGKKTTELGLFNAISNKQMSILFIAAHAKFETNFKNSNITLYDGELSVSKFERMTSSLSAKKLPPDLIVLSACEAAQGGNGIVDASLGLAGVAARSGANTVIASLWIIRIPEVLVGDINRLQGGSFFQSISDKTRVVTKAKALQERKKLLMKSHSIYDWAAFVLIGDWGVF